MKLFKNYYRPVVKTLCLVMSFFYPLKYSGQFTLGNLTVLQVGDGSSTLINTGNAIILKEFSPAGNLTYSMAIPSTSSNALVISGSASSEGFLSLSADKKYLVFGGYAKALPNTTPLPGATASTVNRGIGMVGGSGLTSYSIITSPSFFTGSNIRSAAAADKLNLWASGGSQGTNYFGSASAPVTIQNSKTNLRATAIFNGQLYCSSQVATGTPADIGIYAVGTGTPTNNGQVISTSINTGTGSQPAQFYFNSMGTACYVADQRNTASGGIQKWIQSAGSWSLAYTLPTGIAAIGATGVVVDFSGTHPVVYATTNESNHNRLIAVTDAGAASTATTLATATTANTAFKGLAFSPCSPPVVNALSSASTVCENQTLTLNAPTVGSLPVSWSWSGPGTITSPNSQNPVIAAVAGIYTVTAANMCGSETSTISVSTSSLPAVVAASVTVCTGQAATLTAVGATNYLWSNGSTSTSLIVTPVTTTQYTVTGTLSNGCSKTITTQVKPANMPAVTVNSVTLCAGTTTVLVAGGANSFTWNTGANSSSIVINPPANTSYTVSGSLNGCPGISTAVVTASVLPAPVLTITGASITCGGSAVTQTVSGAATYSWNFGATTNTISVLPLVTTVYSVTGTGLNGCNSTATSTINLVNAPVLTVSSDPSYLCQETIAATLSVAGAENYSWSNGQTGSVITVDNPFTTTTYTVTGMLGQNCVAKQQYTLTFNICEGFNTRAQEPGIILFPNPAHTQFSIQFDIEAMRSLALINASGELVLTVDATETNLDIDLAGYPKGLYAVCVVCGNQRSYTKLVIE